MAKAYTYRKATLADIAEIKELFTQTVLTVNRKDYTGEEVADWAACGGSDAHWEGLINNLHFIVATAPDGTITGFAAIRDDGYLHSLFVHKDHLREGIAAYLLAMIEHHATDNGLCKITTEASITARPFFEKHGYATLAEQKARAKTICMTNYKMAKTLCQRPGTLSSRRLVLRRWEESDAETLYLYAKDPAVGPIAGWAPHKSQADSLETIRTVFAAPETYAVVLKGTDRPIGCAGIITGDNMNISPAGDDEAEIGYWIGRPHWGNGFATEAAATLLRRCFDTLSMETVWCAYYDGNLRSRRVMDKCGFSYHHTNVGTTSPLGDLRTEHFMKITKEEWEAAQLNSHIQP